MKVTLEFGCFHVFITETQWSENIAVSNMTI